MILGKNDLGQNWSGELLSRGKILGCEKSEAEGKMDVVSGGQNLAGHFVQSSIRSEIVLKYSATR